jgi:hypothetical protein
MPARFINVSNSGQAKFTRVTGNGRAVFGGGGGGGGTTSTTTTTTTISMPYYSYGATRCSTGGSVTVISVNSLTRFSTYKTSDAAPPATSECYTINTTVTMTADAPTHTFYITDTNDCLDSSCIQ